MRVEDFVPPVAGCVYVFACLFEAVQDGFQGGLIGAFDGGRGDDAVELMIFDPLDDFSGVFEEGCLDCVGEGLAAKLKDGLCDVVGVVRCMGEEACCFLDAVLGGDPAGCAEVVVCNEEAEFLSVGGVGGRLNCLWFGEGRLAELNGFCGESFCDEVSMVGVFTDVIWACEVCFALGVESGDPAPAESVAGGIAIE